MKKIMLVSVVFLLLFSINAVALASNEKEVSINQFKVTEKYSEIMDIDELLTTNNQSLVQISKSVQKEENVTITEIKAVQLLSKQENISGDFVKDYVSSTTAIIQGSGSGDKGSSIPDTSLSCTISSRIYYTKTTINGRDMIYLTKVTGNVTKPTPMRVKIEGATLLMGQTGFKIGGFAQQSTTFNVFGSGMITSTGGNFSKTPPSSWVPVAEDPSSTVMGGSLTIRFYTSTGTNNWSTTLTNNLY